MTNKRRMKRNLLLGVLGIATISALAFWFIKKDPYDNHVDTETSYTQKEINSSNNTSSSSENNSSETETTEDITTESSVKIYNQEAHERVKAEEDKRRKENEFKTVMSNEETQQRLKVDYDKIDWNGIELSEEDFQDWLNTVFTDYLDTFYTVNFKKEQSIISLAVIGSNEETEDVKVKLEPVLQEALNHSVYKNDSIKINVYTAD